MEFQWYLKSNFKAEAARGGGQREGEMGQLTAWLTRRRSGDFVQH